MKLLRINKEAYKVFCSKYSGDEVDWKLTFNLISNDNNNFKTLELEEYKDETINKNVKPVTLYSFYYYEPINTITKLLNATTIAATMLLNNVDGQRILNKLKTVRKLYKEFKKL